jgi:ferredoxin-NADP reductase
MPVARKVRCQVERITVHGEHVYTLHLRPETQVPQFRPGQFLHLALDDYDPSGFWPESRVFSIASSPKSRDHLCIVYSVRGRYTARMENDLAVGRWVWVKLPYGEFTIDASLDAVLLAGGTGITAFTAFLEALTPDHGHQVYLGYGARRRGLWLYRSMIEQRLPALPMLHVRYFVEDAAAEDAEATPSTVLNGIPPFADSACLSGQLSVADMWALVTDPFRASYYISGPPAMLKAFSRDLCERGVDRQLIRTDAWE